MNNLMIVFKKPYQFEGKEYKEIDLSGIEDMSTLEIVEAEKEYAANGNIPAMQEMSIAYACFIAAKATKMPVNFFFGLPGKEGMKVKMALQPFFYE